ncbi:uncharacterized protein LOC123978257 [Micropterus dolomieu]|uniref:uncharacterized protein LOC123978257 n=1 Tax=Micropterus dolomieu TaxID=147949 RepID=UPI001E8CC009|nr:uncharacterized protein LOC123978257 [Micropterus dolomieu]
MSLFLILVLHLSAVTGQHPPSFVVRDGYEVTLPCGNVIYGQDKCDDIIWLFSSSRSIGSVELILRGQISENAKSKSDRLSVTENCSLVIKNVTVEDVGYYTCRQIKSGQDSHVYLSVIIMTEHKDTEKVTLTCSVSTDGQCEHTVKWLYEGKEVDKDNKDMKTSQTDCLDTVTFLTSYLKKKSQYNAFKCEVTDGYSKVQLFDFRSQSSGDQTGEMATTTIRNTKNGNKISRPTITVPTNSNTPSINGWWLYIIGAIGLVVLLIIIVTCAIRWKRSKEDKTQTDKNTGQSLIHAVTESAPETSQDTADPEDGVSYASISYTRKTNSKGRERVKNDDADEDDAVTYSSVKVSSSSAGASADPSDLYATINKPNK